MSVFSPGPESGLPQPPELLNIWCKLSMLSQNFHEVPGGECSLWLPFQMQMHLAQILLLMPHCAPTLSRGGTLTPDSPCSQLHRSLNIAPAWPQGLSYIASHFLLTFYFSPPFWNLGTRSEAMETHSEYNRRDKDCAQCKLIFPLWHWTSCLQICTHWLHFLWKASWSFMQIDTW